ncbi:hypothetical protein TrVE_jg8811 [Triparma verrucosa]|uniref:Uncharacterized protein n=1 Tax=Triparma verrucosa TaxID=1606542 RepID=A0A9W7FC31_9STRA|nr:hypothetical protein TrVE_jg8811 [Triparma verrucosa]
MLIQNLAILIIGIGLGNSFTFYAPVSLQKRKFLLNSLSVDDLSFSVDDLLETDVVLFAPTASSAPDANKKLLLGYIDEKKFIQPLCMFEPSHYSYLFSSSSSSSSSLSSTLADFVHDEEGPKAEYSPPHDCEIVHVISHEIITPSARQVGGGQGLGNPHGEHCEDVYTIDLVDLVEDLGEEYIEILNVPLREGRM